MNKLSRSLITLALAGVTAVAQQTPAPKTDAKQPEAKAAAPATPRKADKAAAYYHYTLAHMYEEQVAVYGRSDLANKAIEEYRLAIDADPTSEYLTSGLAELYAKTGRIRDAQIQQQSGRVLEAFERRERAVARRRRSVRQHGGRPEESDQEKDFTHGT